MKPSHVVYEIIPVPGLFFTGQDRYVLVEKYRTTVKVLAEKWIKNREESGQYTILEIYSK